MTVNRWLANRRITLCSDSNSSGFIGRAQLERKLWFVDVINCNPCACTSANVNASLDAEEHGNDWWLLSDRLTSGIGVCLGVPCLYRQRLPFSCLPYPKRTSYLIRTNLKDEVGQAFTRISDVFFPPEPMPTRILSIFDSSFWNISTFHTRKPSLP